MGWKLALVFLTVSIGTGVYIAWPHEAQPPPLGDGWWGKGDKKDIKADESIRKFEINFHDDQLEDLKLRLRNTRYFDGIEGVHFNYGIRPDYMRTVVEYWLNKYDWRQQEKILNEYNHYKTNIEGIDIHYVRIKPDLKPGQKAIPLLMIHGWPGSFYEFYKIIPMMNDAKYGGDQSEVYELIIPSIPGYGFSEAAHRPGLNTRAAGRIFDKMMVRLGFNKYYLQGGDWGGAIVDNMAVQIPEHVLGVHTNLPVTDRGGMWSLQIFIGSYFPSLILPPVDHSKVWPFMDTFYYLLQESGYFHLQATKPDTVGHALNDSPVGLAAYILEKFSTWTNRTWRELDDGGLHNWDMDELLNNVMIYWLNGAITSSMRFYKENILLFSDTDRAPIKVPSGIADCPEELSRTPEPWTRGHFHDLVQYTTMPHCGHFAVFEVPELMARDIREFLHKVEKGIRP